jgi:hypothetical protein
MKILNNIIDMIYLMETNQIKKYIAIFITSFLIFISVFQFLFILKINNLTEKKKKIIDTHKQIQILTKKKYTIELIKQKIETVLKKDSYFFIKDYVNSLIEKENLKNNVIEQDGIPLEQPSKKGYVEISYNFGLKNINIQQITNFLLELESNERVYLKEVSIKKDENKSIECTGSLATLRFAE